MTDAKAMSATSTAPDAGAPVNPLVLGSELGEMERLPPWVDAIAAANGVGETTRFGMQLCLEEVVSNVIRHGYGEQSGHMVSVTFQVERPGSFVFTVEDGAPRFNPLDREALAVHEQPEDILGGQGIRLLRGFSQSLEYEALPGGNRLRIGFEDR